MSSTLRRNLIIAALLVFLLLCGAGLWATQTSGASEVIVAGAQDVAVASRGLGDLRISYSVDGQAYGWRDLVWQRLIGSGWRGRDYTFGTTLRFTVTSYQRSSSLGPLRILESAVVGGDPDDPHLVIIEYHRRLQLAGFSWP